MVESTPLISFIIPCYNQGALVLETIKSVLSQHYSPIEIWLVNDGSTDSETLEALKILPEEVNLINIENSGPSVARNLAVQHCKGKYIVPLDGDDLILPDTIFAAVNVLEQNENIGVVYGNNQLFGAENKLNMQAEFNSKQIFLYNTIAFCTVIRKSAFQGVGGLDEWMSKKGLEDWEFWIKLYVAGWNFHYINQTFFKIRVAKTSRTFQVANKNLDLLQEYVWKKHAVTLAKQYRLLYHENKNFLNSRAYCIGSTLLFPFQKLKRLFE